MLRRGELSGLVRDDLPDELLFGFIAAIDFVGDDYILERLDNISREEVYTLQNNVVDAMRRLLSP